MKPGLRILYGVQGTGNGHITRARALAQTFKHYPHIKVDYVFSGRAPDAYFDMQEFGDYRALTGLSFCTDNGAINYWQTLKSAQCRRFFHDLKQLDVSGYDLLLNDFEPLTAWAAKRAGLTAISISHQASFVHPVPQRDKGWIDSLITRFFAPAPIQLGVHWYHFGYPILPPFMDQHARPGGLAADILVYLPFEHLSPVRSLLLEFPDRQFACFHPQIKQVKREANINWQPLSKSKFKRALQRCDGVIANGGFELASECLHYGKRLLIKPLKGQFEQASNAFTLSELHLCEVMNSLDKHKIEHWLTHAKGQKIQFNADPHDFVNWLLARQWHDTESLCRQLWQQVTFPPKVVKRLQQQFDPAVVAQNHG